MLDRVSLVLSIIGGINWLLVGLFRFDLVAYLFGDNWASQTAFKVLALVMLVIGGLAAYTFVWDLGDVGIALMTIFNIAIILPMGKEALDCLEDYEKKIK